jgi:nucleotide-binding universal stress UspA family protein
MYEHLLVALDGSPAAERVLEHAQAFAHAFGSTITLLRATISPEMVLAETAPAEAGIGPIGAIQDPTPIVEADHATAVEYLENVAKNLRASGYTVNVEAAEGPADEVIVDRAKELNVSIILMTTHGRSGLGRVVFGSVADAVLRHTESAVLLVRITHAMESGSA